MEQNNKNILFFDLCRLCLEKQANSVIFEIKDLSKNIYTCMGIKVKESDDLPNKICKTCLKIVMKFIELKTTASKNNEYLRSLFMVDKDGDENAGDSTNTVNEEEENDIISCNAESKIIFLSVRKDLYETPTTSSEIPNNNNKESSSAQKRNTLGKDKQIKCDVCSKVFKTWKQNYLHQRSHNKTRVCPIDVCGKKFATKGDLEKHVRAHTGEKPFKCDECNTSFTQRVSLKAHKIKIHNMSAT